MTFVCTGCDCRHWRVPPGGFGPQINCQCGHSIWDHRYVDPPKEET